MGLSGHIEWQEIRRQKWSEKNVKLQEVKEIFNHLDSTEEENIINQWS